MLEPARAIIKNDSSINRIPREAASYTASQPDSPTLIAPGVVISTMHGMHIHSVWRTYFNRWPEDMIRVSHFPFPFFGRNVDWIPIGTMCASHVHEVDHLSI
jgi:hypothetical protein